MTKRVSQRTLERLAAGALDEKTTADLMARLEPGEVERLEALIRENEAFLEEHPPELVVPKIRARLEEEAAEERAAARAGAVLEQKRAPQWWRPALVVAFVVVLIIGAFFWLGDSSVDDSAESVEGALHAEAEAPEDTEAARVVGGGPSDVLEDGRWDREPLRLGPWEMHPLEREEEVRRVVVDDESIARAGLVGQERSLRIYGIREGDTAVEVFYADGEAERFLLQVRLPEEENLRPYEVGLTPGEVRLLASEGVIRISTQDEEVAHLDVEDDAVILEAVGPGETMVHFVTAQREQPYTFRVFVGELLDGDEVQRLLEAHRAELRACGAGEAGGRAAMAVMVASDGTARAAFAEEHSLADEALECVLALVKSWAFQGHELEAAGLIRFVVEL